MSVRILSFTLDSALSPVFWRWFLKLGSSESKKLEQKSNLGDFAGIILKSTMISATFDLNNIVTNLVYLEGSKHPYFSVALCVINVWYKFVQRS